MNSEDALGLLEDISLLRRNRARADTTFAMALAANKAIRYERRKTDVALVIAIKLRQQQNINAQLQQNLSSVESELQKARQQNAALQQKTQELQQRGEDYLVGMNNRKCSTNAALVVNRRLAEELAALKGTDPEEEVARARRVLSRQYDKEALEFKAEGYVNVDLRQSAAQTFPWYVPEV